MSAIGKTAANVSALPFEGLVSFQNPLVLWNEHWFALVLEITAALILCTILKHAKKNGTDFYLILAALITAISFEILPLIPRPGYQLWWYHQGVVNILKKRVPSFVITSFAIVHYASHRMTDRSQLPIFSRSVMTAILATLLFLPALWLSPRLLLNLYHLDDPVFQNRILDIPYMQIVVSFLLFLHASQVFLEFVEMNESTSRSALSSVWCSAKSGFVSGVYALVEQYLLYIAVCLIVGANSGMCLLATVAILVFLIKKEPLQLKSYSLSGWFEPFRSRAFWASVVGLVMLSLLPCILRVENLRSNGSRMELGPCHIQDHVSNTSPLEIPRRRFVCPEDSPQLHFDFHCVDPETLAVGVQHNVRDYIICGKPIAEGAVQGLLTYSCVCIAIIYSLMRLEFHFESEHQQKLQMPKSS